MDELLLFMNYLESKGLGDETLYAYGVYIKILDEAVGGLGNFNLTQEVIDAFLADHNHGVAKACMKNYIKFKKRFDLEIPERTGRKEKKETIIIPKEQLEQLREYLYQDHLRYGLLFDLSYFGALRRDEVVNVRLSDFNVDEVLEDTTKPIKLVVTGKGKKQRTVLLPRATLKAVVLYADENGITEHNKLFEISKKRWWRHFYNACIKLGFTKEENGKLLPKYHPHSLRHSRSSEWLENGANIIAIQQRLGHNDIATTMIYLHPDKKKMEDAWNEELKAEEGF